MRIPANDFIFQHKSKCIVGSGLTLLAAAVSTAAGSFFLSTAIFFPHSAIGVISNVYSISASFGVAFVSGITGIGILILALLAKKRPPILPVAPTQPWHPSANLSGSIDRFQTALENFRKNPQTYQELRRACNAFREAANSEPGNISEPMHAFCDKFDSFLDRLDRYSNAETSIPSQTLDEMLAALPEVA